jgi:hypothetical protein
VEEAEYPERTTDHGQVTGKHYHLRLQGECSLFSRVAAKSNSAYNMMNIVWATTF